ncbi:alpha/beta-Hydrolases superfamily protein [Actinidia rufa]|uniref:Alpha/beta-Hydrolases superfamily protein n=1 Tax=Actinidia rufa TaxID=165716 RepID=A0A7J0EK85_9ERIC|nr:alpha/beta-Hydrolases superfamily protein [Actinidia rufa]
MGSNKLEVSVEVLPYLRVYKDGTIERIAGTEVTPADLDPQTASDPLYHNSLNILVSKADIVVLSVDYRRSPEHPLPAAYEDSWAALQWVASHSGGGGSEAWLKESVDFGRVFLAGDSAGANISHHMAIRAGLTRIEGLKIHGIVMIHPYFWGEEPIGSEVKDPIRKAMVDCWWRFVCPSEKGGDDPLMNPFVDGAPSLSGLACDRVMCVCCREGHIERSREAVLREIDEEWVAGDGGDYGDRRGGSCISHLQSLL